MYRHPIGNATSNTTAPIAASNAIDVQRQTDRRARLLTWTRRRFMDGIVRFPTRHSSARAGGRQRGCARGPVHSNGAPQRPVSFYRLSAVCQPTLEKLVAGAGFEPATFGL